MSPERDLESDRELWRRLAAGDAVASAPVSDLELAAWLEGRLPETAAADIEAAVAADPELRRAALELAEILGKPLPAAPARLEVRARALVGFAAERQESEGQVGLLGWLFVRGRRFALRRALALAAVVVVAVSGFLLGGGLGTSVAERRYAANLPHSSNANELTEFLVSDGI